MDNTAKQYGVNIAEKMQALQQAFRAELDTYNDYYAAEIAENSEVAAAENIAKNDSFIREYLIDQVMDLAKAVLDADVYGMYCAGFVPVAASREEYRAKEQAQTANFYDRVNKSISDFTAKMAEWSEPITESK